MTTLSFSERLRTIECELPNAESLAQAERAFEAVNGDGANPWAGACRKHNDLRTEAEDLRLQIKGHELIAARAELQNLERELSDAEKQRVAADREVHAQAQHPTIQKWNAATAVAMANGWGHSWVLYSNWFVGTKPKRPWAPDCSTFFEGDSGCPQSLRFSENDRAIVRGYMGARGAAEKALLHCGNLTDRKQRLLQEHPELNHAG
jgi:hypothetical protein